MPTRSKSSPPALPAVSQTTEIPLLPDSVPVEMPELPRMLPITTLQQFRAVSDPMRTRILGIIQHQPATAKQIADRLKATPGAIGHHLKVLEKAGLAQVVAKRVIRGIIAKYYTRTARIFNYDLPDDLTDESVRGDIFRAAYREFTEALSEQPDGPSKVGFPRARLSEARIKVYYKRLEHLMDSFLAEPSDPHGKVYSLSLALFESPSYVQLNADVLAKRAAKKVAANQL